MRAVSALRKKVGARHVVADGAGNDTDGDAESGVLITRLEQLVHTVESLKAEHSNELET